MSILVNADEHREEILKAAIAKSRKATVASGAAGAAAGGAIGAGAGHLLAEASKVGAHSKAGRIMRAKGAVGTGAALGLTAAGTAAGVARLRRKPVEKSASATAGRAVRDFKRGAQRGVRLAGKGHTHTGQIGSGVAGRPTFSVRSGMPAAGRAGIHAGVLAGNAPTLAAGAAVGAGLEHRKVSKSAFGVELAKALGDDNSVRGAVRGDYTPPAVSSAVKAKKIKLALGPAKSALLAAAKK